MAVVEPTLDVEQELWAQGWTVVLGCDEVGRGAIAGPVSVGVAAVSLDRGAFPPGLRDSKLLSPARREAVLPHVDRWVSGWAIGESSAQEIDEAGIIACLGRAAARALERVCDGIDVDSAIVVLDGKHDWLTPALGVLGERLHVITRIKADRDCASVAAASVLAKVGRDGQMTRYHDDYDDYAWASNKGYGSVAHYAGIDRVGPSPLHRVTWLSSAAPPSEAAVPPV